MADQIYTEYKNPEFSPYIDSGFKGAWIKMVSKEVKEMTAFTRNDSGGLILGDDMITWEYLAPQQIMETINHSWEPWETISSRMAGKGKEFVQLSKEGKSIISAIKQSNWGTDIGDAFKALSSVGKANMKVDTPLVYENSERREFTFQFNLVANKHENAHKMLMGVRFLQKHSSPVMDGLLGIEFPYVFSVETTQGDDNDIQLINMEVAALTSVQPTYMSPYDEQGYPMRIELTLTFKELTPLYTDSFDL